MPTIQTILPTLSRKKYFSKIDLKSCYHQMEIDEESRFLTTYSHDGVLYQFRRLQMGISSAPALCQFAMKRLFEDHRLYTEIYLDDLIVYSDTLEEMDRYLKAIFLTCRARNIQLSLPKCEFGKEEVIFLGHTIAQNYISTPQSYIEPIVDQNPPLHVQAMRSWIGSTCFLAEHLDHLQKHLQPFHDVISRVSKVDARKKAPIPWDDDLLEHFEQVKTYIRTCYKPLLIPDLNRPFTIYSDASRVGCGAVLLQRHPDTNVLTPVSFYSHLWHPPHSYSSRDLEIMAVHKALKHYRHLLRTGRQLEIFTDHKSLTNNLDPDSSTTPAPLAHWLHHLGCYNIAWRWVKGSDNTIADLLSRYLHPTRTSNPPQQGQPYTLPSL
jgi:hypothetical protein